MTDAMTSQNTDLSSWDTLDMIDFRLEGLESLPGIMFEVLHGISRDENCKISTNMQKDKK
jgi:hypothetical protein